MHVFPKKRGQEPRVVRSVALHAVAIFSTRTKETMGRSVGARVSTVYKINTGACSRSERATDDGQDEARRMEAASVLH